MFSHFRSPLLNASVKVHIAVNGALALWFTNRVYCFLVQFADDFFTATDCKVPIPALKAIYVDNVKVGSTSMRLAFNSLFKSSWFRTKWRPFNDQAPSLNQLRPDAESVPVVQITQDIRRTHAAHLTDEMIKNWTFFSFVREPYGRFASGHAQAIATNSYNLGGTLSGEKPGKKPCMNNGVSKMKHFLHFTPYTTNLQCPQSLDLLLFLPLRLF
jgi:hypothetical protein